MSSYNLSKSSKLPACIFHILQLPATVVRSCVPPGMKKITTSKKGRRILEPSSKTLEFNEIPLIFQSFIFPSMLSILAHNDEFWRQIGVKKWLKMASDNHQKSNFFSKSEKVIFTSVYTLFLLILAPPKSIIFRPLRKPKIDEKMNLKTCFNKKQKKHNLERSCVEKCAKMAPKMGAKKKPFFSAFCWSMF